MGRAKLTAFVLLCLIGGAAPAAAAPQPRGPAPAAEQKPRDEAGKAQQQAAVPPAARAGGRRRNNYASCNRESHKRNLRGGARRRFLIRCKLGYEPRQPSRAADPSAAGRRS